MYVPRGTDTRAGVGCVHERAGDPPPAGYGKGTEGCDREPTCHGIGHTHYIFRGDHVDRLPDRYIRMLRMFSVKWR